MIIIAKDSTHESFGKLLVIEQWKNKPRFAAWMRAYLRQVQLVEDAAYDVLMQRLIDYAAGPRLLTIGKIVGQTPPASGGDDEFKVYINARIQTNRSRGTLQNVMDVIGMLSTTDYAVNEDGQMSMDFEFVDPLVRDPVVVYSFARDAKAAGAKLTFTVPTTDIDNRFLYSDANAPDVAGTNGFGDATTPDVTGLLSDSVSIRDPSRVIDVPGPQITSIYPNTGPANGGTDVTILGKGFAGTTVVRLAAAVDTPTNLDNVVIVGDTVIRATTRAIAPGDDTIVKLFVRTPIGEAALFNAFTFGPAAAAISPTHGDSGDAVVIHGAGFTDTTGVFTYVYGSLRPFTSFTVVSDSEIDGIIPPGYLGTHVPILIETPHGSYSVPGGFQYNYAGGTDRPCVVTGISPSHGSAAGGYTVTITGSGFLLVNDVEIEIRSIGFTIVDDNTITFTMPSSDDLLGEDAGDASGTSLEIDVIIAPSNQDQTSFTYD